MSAATVKLNHAAKWWRTARRRLAGRNSCWYLAPRGFITWGSPLFNATFHLSGKRCYFCAFAGGPGGSCGATAAAVTQSCDLTQRQEIITNIIHSAVVFREVGRTSLLLYNWGETWKSALLRSLTLFISNVINVTSQIITERSWHLHWISSDCIFFWPFMKLFCIFMLPCCQ